ncbi:ABC transporter ATP-binding protein [Nocardioides anomalus]|uniref:ABC transporter ATP-binding protein n=1 Tax=Nocardioides anomalus TaxID=2712223 RepID=A0A6G6WEA4_9ACTN|nr:ABC transporter ATP-binding protein [Nocardioides anomalus]QIG43658.1 ABC transporter ATP-binding protein [Nocardioides anomalus]
MIEAQALTKRYDAKLAVDDLSFTVRPGVVTGFLGPNGAGKSTTMRMMIGLDRPSSGSVSINGRPYAEHAAPLHEVGALLEARGIHPGRSARNHLRALALTSGISRGRVDQVLDMVGLTSVAGQRVGSFSLGMGQRLGVAAALLGDPHTLILDEPVNGLDLDGIRWIRALLRRLADEGRTVFLSSHLMSEMAVTADHVIVIGQGRLLRDQPMADFIREADVDSIRVVTPDRERLAQALERSGATVTTDQDSTEPALTVAGTTAREVGTLAAEAGITLWELTPSAGSLEDAYLALTRESLDYQDRADDPSQELAS